MGLSLILHYWTDKIFDLMMALKKSKGIAKVIRIHPLGIMDTCTKYPGNPSSSSQDISLEGKNVILMVALEVKVQGLPQSGRIHPLGNIKVSFGEQFHATSMAINNRFIKEI